MLNYRDRQIMIRDWKYCASYLMTLLNLRSAISPINAPFSISVDEVEWLNLSYCNRITMLGLKPLVGLTRLQFLDLQGCVKVKTSYVRRLKFKTITIHK